MRHLYKTGLYETKGPHLYSGRCCISGRRRVRYVVSATHAWLLLPIIIIIIIIIIILTPWRRVLLEKLTGLQLVKKFPAFHGTRRFITALTSVRHLSLSWASPIQSIYPHPTSWRSILILSTHLRLGLPSGLQLLLELPRPSLPKLSLYLRFPDQNFIRISQFAHVRYQSVQVIYLVSPSRCRN